MTIFTNGGVGTTQSSVEDLSSDPWEALSAKVNLSWMDNPGVRLWNRQGRNRDAYLSQDQKDVMARDSGEKLDTTGDYTAKQLQQVIDRKRERRILEDAANRSPGGFVNRSVQFLGSFGAAAVDPLNVASAFIPFVGEAKYAALLERAGAGTFARGAVRARVGAIEGAAGAAVLEPVNLALGSRLQDDYTMTDSLVNIAFGGLLGGTLHPVAGGIKDKFGGISFKPDAGTEDIAPLKFSEPMPIAETGEALMPSHVIQAERVLAQEAESVRATKKLADAGFDTARTFYHGTPAGNDIRSFTLDHTGENTGSTERAIFVTDNPEVASAYASRERVMMDDFGSSSQIEHGSVYPVHINPDKQMDASGLVDHYDRATFDSIIELARKEGFDSVDFGNIVDAPGASVTDGPRGNVIAVLNPEKIASKIDVINEVQKFTPEQNQLAFHTAFVQANNGVMPDVEHIFYPSDDPLSDILSSAKRQTLPEAQRLANTESSDAATRTIEEAIDEPYRAVEADLTATLERLDGVSKGLTPEQQDSIKTSLKAFDEAISESERLAEAAKIAAHCGI